MSKVRSPFIIANFTLIIMLLLKDKSVVAATANQTNNSTNVYMGVVLDLSSPMDNMIDICLSTALSDFYEAHPHYKTRLHLHAKNVEEELDVNFAVLEMLRNGEVHGVLGPQWSKEALFVAELGARAHVPVISFTAKTRGFPHLQSPYSVRTTPADIYQVKALAAICQGFDWDQVVVLYEDTEYGSGFVSELNKAFKKVDIRLASMVGISSSSKDSEIKEELTGLMAKQTRVFVVHMNILLGQRLFALARSAKMMEKGYAWLITDILSNFLTSVDSSSMENVLGIRPHVPKSDSLDKFRAKWRRNALSMNSENQVMNLNVYGLSAYDTVWALAMAVEMAKPQMADFLNSSQGSNINVKVSQFGQRVLTQLLNSKFTGLTGEFQLVDGQLQPLGFEIFNVIGSGDRTVGYWSPARGISSNVSSDGDPIYSTSTKELRAIMWPGDTLLPPKCWGIPTTGKLKVGVPKKQEFLEFVNIQLDPLTNDFNISGYSVDIFLASLDYLSEYEDLKLDYEFVPYLNSSNDRSGSYNEMLREMNMKRYDFVIGDVSILASRSEFVAFTPPYTESGIVRVMKIRKSLNMWNFLKPLRWDLWLSFAAACIFIGGVLGLLEHDQNPSNDTNTLVPPEEEQRLRFFFWLPIAVLAFPERNLVANKWSNFILVIWLFVFNILMQSYTAKLSSIFTVDQLSFAFTRDCYVGYQNGTFVKEFLINELLFQESKLKNYTTIKEYHEAINLGSKKGGVDAIYGEIPYVKLIVNGHKSDYRIVEPTYQTGGLGFAFPEDSPLVKYFSRAILHVTQNQSIMTGIEQKNFGPGYNSDHLDSINQENSSLTTYNFGGLFIIVIAATIFALFFSKTSIGQSLAVIVSNSGRRCSSFLIYGGNKGRVHSLNEKDSKSSEQSDNSKVNNSNERIETGDSSESEESDSNGLVREGEIQLS